MARTFSSVNEAWRELRNAQSRDRNENPAGAHTRHGYDPNQPRIPAGNSDGGQWTDKGDGENERRILSDVALDNDWVSGAQYANRRGGRSGSVVINGQIVPVEPGQAARLAMAEARAHDALSRVRELDPSWRPKPSAYTTVEGLIRTYEGEVRQAEGRFAELTRAGIGPGPFAGESIPARGPGRDFTASERREINRILNETGCHTCGIRESGTPTGNAILDHQPPTRWTPHNRLQRLFPHCWSCSGRQGNWISRNRGTR